GRALSCINSTSFAPRTSATECPHAAVSSEPKIHKHCALFMAGNLRAGVFQEHARAVKRRSSVKFASYQTKRTKKNPEVASVPRGLPFYVRNSQLRPSKLSP